MPSPRVSRHRLVLPRIADIEIGERHGARARRSGDVDLGVEREQRRREIAAEGGEAHAAALRRDMADFAGRLEAMVIGLAPPFALIVEDAARVEREIAADGSHVAVGRAGDVGGGLRHHRIVLRPRRDARRLRRAWRPRRCRRPRASALMPRSSATPLISMSTGGATMPRLMFTRRSVPPPSNRLSGCAARASTNSSSVRGRTRSNCGSASIKRRRSSCVPAPASRARQRRDRASPADR